MSKVEVKKEVTDSVKKGVEVDDIFEVIRKKFNIFCGKNSFDIDKKEEKELDETIKTKSKYVTMLGIGGNQSIVENTTNMALVRGLSVKHVLDLIPRHNGHNIPFSQFIEGCEEAQSVLPANAEDELVSLMRIRLQGEALDTIRGQTFTTVAEMTGFLEEIFVSPKTYYECSGELASLKQKTQKSVISYYNKLRDARDAVKTAAQRENRYTVREVFEASLETDC